MISNRIVQKNNVAGGITTNLWGWGLNGTYDRFIVNGGTSFSSPVMSTKYSSTYSWKMISNGDNFACGIDTSDKLYCWGSNNFGQLGIGNTTYTSNPTNVGGGTWKKVYCGTDHVVAISSSDLLWCWGRNDQGQLGDGTKVDRSSPVQVSGGGSWIKASAGHKFSAGIKFYSSVRGYLYTWGTNTSGQLGDSTTSYKTNPTNITYGSYPAYMWDNITTGYAHCLATANNYLSGKILVWGDNADGQLGNATTNNYSSPVLINSPTTDIIVLEAGGNTSAIIDYNKKLYTFGANHKGQIGNNNASTYFSSPQYILGDCFLVEIAAKTRRFASTFIRTDSTTKIYSWGYNGVGQLGDGTTVDKSSPVQVGTDTDWVTLSKTGGIGNLTMFALK